MSGAGPEVLFGSNQRPKRVSIPSLYLLQKRTYLIHQTRFLGLNKLSYFIKQTNKPWTWSKLKHMTSGPSQPLRPLMVGNRWTKSCKPVTGKLTTHLHIEVVPKSFPNLNVVAHLVVPVGWGSCLLRVAIFYFMSSLYSVYVCIRLSDFSSKTTGPRDMHTCSLYHSISEQ